ncbi:type II secretion system minor pseudopilin GspK [Janthinobacterium sp. 17J80-10]|uniref:type II secretion system minor pseudopilin GspK n=1 Tax=Janthinobacterium sp. 17J80-10 TaxID=2497863 RepID=UPI0010058DF9|nr:type II secretion system minor pseudopilin GspK [Janthinobacterium sp. 17J80-10]QAU33279.1 general secretion pathway protein GspK [Janthinobacterium sp. 17J80-10]
MTRPFPRLGRQRGVAVVTALLLTTLAITIVASLFWQQQVQVRSIENQRLQLQKQWILRGALDWSALILRADAATSGADHLGEPWAVPLAETRLDQYVENGQADSDAGDAKLSGGMIDAQSRFNLNNLATGGQINIAELAVFRNLLSELHMNPALAQSVAEAVAAGQPKAAAPGAPAQPASTDNTRPRPTRIEYVDDLLVIPSVTPELLAKLRDFVVILPGTTLINANTAPVEVLAAKLQTIDTLSSADATTLVASRDKAFLRDKCEIGTRLGKTNMTCDALDIQTSYFLVNGKVSMNRAGLEVQALMKREGAAMPRVIWIREN